MLPIPRPRAAPTMYAASTLVLRKARSEDVMLARKLLTLGAVLGVLTVSGAAFSGQTENVTLIAFDPNTELLSTWDIPNNRIGVYLHGDFTNHLPGVINHTIIQIPPDPCHGFINAYNAQVTQIARRGLDPTRRTALLVVIAHMAAAQCGATIDTDPQGNLVSFQPHD
jgi:hypothetical protein